MENEPKKKSNKRIQILFISAVVVLGVLAIKNGMEGEPVDGIYDRLEARGWPKHVPDRLGFGIGIDTSREEGDAAILWQDTVYSMRGGLLQKTIKPTKDDSLKMSWTGIRAGSWKKGRIDMENIAQLGPKELDSIALSHGYEKPMGVARVQWKPSKSIGRDAIEILGVQIGEKWTWQCFYAKGLQWSSLPVSIEKDNGRWYVLLPQKVRPARP